MQCRNCAASAHGSVVPNTCDSVLASTTSCYHAYQHWLACVHSALLVICVLIVFELSCGTVMCLAQASRRQSFEQLQAGAFIGHLGPDLDPGPEGCPVWGLLCKPWLVYLTNGGCY